MENLEFDRAAESTVSARFDYRLLMKFLAKGDVQSADLFCRRYRIKPDLADLLVGSGRLTKEELNDLLDVHQTVGLNELPHGTFFVFAGCISTDELRSFLLLQRLQRYQRTERWGQRLIAAGLLTHSQLQVAIADRLRCKVTLRQAILNRGWLEEPDLDRIF